MPENTAEATTLGTILAAVTLTVALALWVSLWVVAPPSAGSQPASPAENHTATPTPDDPMNRPTTATPACDVNGTCVDNPEDGNDEAYPP